MIAMHENDDEAPQPRMEPLTPEERERFLARARAEGRALSSEEQYAIFGPPPEAPAQTPHFEDVAPMEPAALAEEELAGLAHNFFPELPAAPALPLVRGVIFDFDDTLAELTRPHGELLEVGARAAEAYMRSQGMDLPDDFATNIVEARRFAEEKSEEEEEEHLADDAMSFLLQFFGYPASRMDPQVLKTAVDVFYAPEMTAWRLKLGAKETLLALQRQGCRLALPANYNCDRVFQRTVDYLGLRPFFDVCLCSAAVEYRKPDARFFQLALDRWDALPYEVVVVGDSLLHDVRGGLELGALTIRLEAASANPQVAHGNQANAETIHPDALIANLGEIPALIQEWMK